MTRILNLAAYDLRFPTSTFLDGSDAMNPDPDYSAAYVVLSTDHPRGLAGHGFTFTIGRGNEICVKAIEAFRSFVVGRSLEEIIADMGGFWRGLAGDSQLRWLGPEKGVVHLALAAVLNAVWDLWAKSVGKPVWKLVADLTPEEFLSVIDFRDSPASIPGGSRSPSVPMTFSATGKWRAQFVPSASPQVSTPTIASCSNNYWPTRRSTSCSRTPAGSVA